MLHPVVDPGVQPEGQAEALGVHRVDHGIDLGRLEGRHVQDRAENLFLHVLDARDLDGNRCKEAALARCGDFMQHPALGAGLRDIGRDVVTRRDRDDRPHIGGRIPRVGNRQFVHRPFQHLQERGRDILLHVKAAQGRASLARRLEGGGHDIAHRLFGQGRGIHDHGVQPPGFRNKRRMRRNLARHGPVDALRGGGRAGEADTRHAGIARQKPADPAALARQQLKRMQGHARLVHQPHADSGHQRRGLRRFRQYGIARRQRRRDLPGENGQREVPGADAGEDAARGVLGCLLGVVAQEIHRLAQFGNGVEQALARLARQHGEDLSEMVLVEIGGLQKRRTPICCRGVPGPGRAQRGFDIRLGCLDNAAYEISGARGVHHLFLRFPLDRACQNRHRLPDMRGEGGTGGLDLGQVVTVARVEPAGIAPRPEEGDRGLHPRRAGFDHGRQRLERVGGHNLGGHLGIDDLVHEAAVRPVFQKPPHQVGQEVAMRAHGGIDPAAGGVSPVQYVMQRLAHAVQALELERIVILGHVQDRRRRMGIVRGELRVDAVRIPKEFPRAAQVGHVGRRLVGVDREARQPLDLGTLDLGIPVGPFHEADHDLAVKLGGQRVKPVDHGRRALAIGLHHHAEPVPSGKAVIAQHRLDHVERDVEPVGLFRVDVEPHPGALGVPGQLQHARHKLVHHAGALHILVARMQCGELDRDAGVGADIVMPRLGGEPGNRPLVGREEVIRIMGGHRRLAQHVIGKGKALRGLGPAALHRLADGLTQDELLAHLFHRPAHGAANDRLAKALDGAAQGRGQARFRVFFQDLARQHQRPGGGVDQRRGGMAQVLAPFRRRDLVLDERIHRLGIRHPEQCFGQAHERHAFFGREPVFGQEHFHQPRLAVVADRLDKPGSGLGHAAAGCSIGRMGAGQTAQQQGFIGKVIGADFCAQSGKLGHGEPLGQEMAQDSMTPEVRLPFLVEFLGFSPYSAPQIRQSSSGIRNGKPT